MKHRLLLPSSSLAKRLSAQTLCGGVCIRRCWITVGRQQQSSQSHNSFFSTTNNTKPPSSETAPFDRSIKLKQRTRAAENCRQHYINLQSSSSPSTTSNNNDEQPELLPYDYFHREIAQRLVDRLDDINIRENGEGGFPLALEIGAGAGFVHDAIVDNGCNDDDELMLDDDNEIQYTGRGGVRKLVQLDSCSAMLHRNDDYITPSTPTQSSSSSSSSICETYKLVTDEEGPFPFPDGTFDLVISSMAFHWINDLPRLLTEIKRVLKPNGCLLFALPGGNTLPELRSCLVLAELERTGGVSTHLGPYIDLSNVGSLLTGTGFKLPTIDVDDIQIGYPNMMVLMEHLGRMGEGNACLNRKDRVGLGTFVAAASLYNELYPADKEDGDDAGGIVASAQIIFGIAWKEHETQQKPLTRGSATHSMTDIAVTKTKA
jgi:NADH dehydrogenase [ubiquinone] 1 alpha subcomplex assembly factor 5